MAFDPYGAPSFGLRDAKVAAYTATNSYGTAVDVPSVQLLGVTLKFTSAELTGDDTVTAIAARAIRAEGRVRFGSVSIAVLEVILGLTSASSIASPNRVKYLKVPGGTRPPYFGLAGVAVAEEGTGDLTVFLPKCKVSGDINLVQLEYGNFAIPEVPFMSVDDATFGIMEIVEHETAITTVAIPTANVA